jgi:hypothetical protein
MKSLKIAVVACSLFAAAAAAYAQNQAPAANGGSQQVTQSDSSSATASSVRADAAKPARNANDCVGPASFCNIYFGN